VHRTAPVRASTKETLHRIGAGDGHAVRPRQMPLVMPRSPATATTQIGACGSALSGPGPGPWNGPTIDLISVHRTNLASARSIRAIGTGLVLRAPVSGAVTIAIAASFVTVARGAAAGEASCSVARARWAFPCAECEVLVVRPHLERDAHARRRLRHDHVRVRPVDVGLVVREDRGAETNGVGRDEPLPRHRDAPAALAFDYSTLPLRRDRVID